MDIVTYSPPNHLAIVKEGVKITAATGAAAIGTLAASCFSLVGISIYAFSWKTIGASEAHSTLRSVGTTVSTLAYSVLGNSMYPIALAGVLYSGGSTGLTVGKMTYDTLTKIMG